MLPTPGDVHVNQPLTNISIAFAQNAANFVADQVFPNIPVAKQSDLYYTYDRAYFNKSNMEVRAPNAESAGAGYTVDATPNYFAPVYALHHDIPDQRRSNSDAVLDPDREGTLLITTQALIKREKLWVAKYFATSIWTTDKTGVASSPSGSQFLQWNDAASTPIEDIRTGKTTVLQSTGFEPNTLVLGQQTYDKLVDHPDIVDRVKYGQTAGQGPARINIQALKALFEVDNLYVMKSIENTAAEGQTGVHAFIGGKKALLCYSNPTPGIMTPSAGYTFSWTGFLGAGTQGMRIKKFRMEQNSADRIEIEMAFDQKKVSADLGYFFTSAVT